jgi:glycolate oxidase
MGDLRRVIGRTHVRSSPVDLALYAYDSSLERHAPDVVVFPAATEEVAQVVRIANRLGVPFVPRGAGTNLSGGSVPVAGGIVIALSRLNRLLRIEPANHRAVVQPCLTNLALQDALAPLGWVFHPDPASQKVSTMGGNVAENAGGPHCLKYGVTTNHVLGVRVVLPDGEVADFGGAAPDAPGYDLVGIMNGSEGTLGIVTEITVRISPRPEAVRTLLATFDSMDAASQAVSAIIAAGIIPASLEMMDRVMIGAIQASMDAGYPLDAEAVLIIEVDGLREALAQEARRCEEICLRLGDRKSTRLNSSH